MVLNEFLSWRRRRAARVVPLSAELIAGLAGPVADHAGRWAERDAALRAIATLPPMQRAVIALRFYEDMSDVEISGLLGCRPGTVRSHVSRALATLRATLPESLTTTRERA
jgi:RNA polymerase sigma factor (sigma-70 family)